MKKENLRTVSQIRPDQDIIVTKWIGLEATTILAKEKEDELTLKDTLGHLRFVEEYLMFQYDEKKQGILDMMKILKGNLEDVVVFGDDYNDMIMFDPRWTSIAMGNACKELKEKASYVTDANVEDGIYKACQKFGWFKDVQDE